MNSLQDIVVVHFGPLSVFPGKTKNHGEIDSVPVHGLDQFTGSHHSGLGRIIEQPKGPFTVKKFLPEATHRFGKNMGVKINDHSLPPFCNIS